MWETFQWRMCLYKEKKGWVGLRNFGSPTMAVGDDISRMRFVHTYCFRSIAPILLVTNTQLGFYHHLIEVGLVWVIYEKTYKQSFLSKSITLNPKNGLLICCHHLPWTPIIRKNHTSPFSRCPPIEWNKERSRFDFR